MTIVLYGSFELDWTTVCPYVITLLSLWLRRSTDTCVWSTILTADAVSQLNSFNLNKHNFLLSYYKFGIFSSILPNLLQIMHNCDDINLNPRFLQAHEGKTAQFQNFLLSVRSQLVLTKVISIFFNLSLS